ncbi:receptor-like protein EIX2 isoform X2 [Phaseolus vulgaris]|uniref:receptor-like protein EIX2 isoform X2 n=1 Tax=Phaseolus vulgaris TaxID=3885 RepID=UPI0035CC56C6
MISTRVSMMSPIGFKVIIFMLCLAFQVVPGEQEMRCLQREREALLQFKASLLDPNGMLSSWTTATDCCQWKGILCSNLTGNIVSLDLHAEYDYETYSRSYIRGEIHESLIELQQLKYLNLSSNYFPDSHIPDFLASLCNLRFLDLSQCEFVGKIPNQFGSLSHLKYLNLEWNYLEGSIPPQLGNLSKLEYLDLRWNKFEGNLPSQFGNLSKLQKFYLGGSYDGVLEINDGGNRLNGKITEDIKFPSQLGFLSISSNFLEGGIPKSFGNACALRTLYMTNNNLTDDFSMIIHHLSGCARHSLQELNLGENQISGTFPDLSVFSALKSLDISENRLSGKITEDIKLPSQLEFLSISSNFLEGGIPKSFGNACALRTLVMADNKFNDEFSMITHQLSGCAKYSLKQLYLSNNKISGTLPNLSMFSSLKKLYVDRNRLNGEIHRYIQFPPQLEELDMQSNSLNGEFTDYHFVNISKLSYLELSDNSLTLTFTKKWIPPFQLRYILLRSCMLGPTFPKWLQTQNNFVDLDISNAGISNTVPRLFWEKLASRNVFSINISNNNLHGIIPNFAGRDAPFLSLTLASNQFEGPIPTFLRSSIFLDLSNNNFTDSLSFLCACGSEEELYQLDLSNNQLSGQIPDCWSHSKLAYLDLSHNKFSGKIPNSLGSLLGLQALLLRNNNLTHEIPFSLRHCTKLVKLDMSGNKLSGHIPAWIGSEMQKLQILGLGRNHFSGILPLQICYLKNIQILDLSLNNLTGKIPACINNFTSMAYKKFSSDYGHYWYFVNTSSFRNNHSYELDAFLMWKGSEQMFKSTGLLLLKDIDLSSNNFSEEVPVEMESLVELISLNLSRNNLIGKIPSNIGKLKSLEFLDLSRNKFVGSIPLSLNQIDRLTMLDLSHNYLGGVIPTSTQLQSFNASSYEDNLNLCGPPLEKCIDDEPTEEAIVKIDEYSLFGHEFYIGMVLGFVISFWTVFGTILFKQSWRHAYFKFLNNLSDEIHVMIAMKFKWCK